MDDTADSTALAVALAEGLCAHLRKRTDEDFGREGYLPHDHMSDFEAAFALLWRMELAQAASPRDDLWDIDYASRDLFDRLPPCFRLVPQDRIAPIIRARGTAPPELIEELVGSYICIICDYDGLDHGRSWFVPGARHLAAMLAFARHGHAQQDGDRFRWTDKAIPAMRMAGLWTETGRPRREVEDDEILAFFRQLHPDAQTALAELAREPHSSVTFTATLAQNHLGQGWGRHFPVLGNAVMQIGTRLHAMLAAGIDPRTPDRARDV